MQWWGFTRRMHIECVHPRYVLCNLLSCLVMCNRIVQRYTGESVSSLRGSVYKDNLSEDSASELAVPDTSISIVDCRLQERGGYSYPVRPQRRPRVRKGPGRGRQRRRMQHAQVSAAQAAHLAQEQLGPAVHLVQQHWVPLAAAAAGLWCLWRFVRFIRYRAVSNSAMR